MKPPEEIKTERLVLRKPRMEDAQAVFVGWFQDQNITYFLTWRPHEDIRQTESMLSRAIAAWDTDARFPYMITLKERDDAIGMIDPRVEDSQMGIGYVLSKALHGNGYMTEATCAIIEWAFQQQGIYRVYATTDIENIPSQRVLEKAGMMREGVLRKHIVHPNISDVPRDSYMYAIVK